MPITKSISSKANIKQKSGADLPQSPALIVTNKYGPATSSAGQTTISLGFAVDQANKLNFFLSIDGRILSEGAANDFVFINVQPNNTSSQIQVNVALVAGMNIQAWYLGVSQPSVSGSSLSTLQAQVNQNSASIPKNFLLNSDFLFWQRGVSTTVANAATGFQADRWYVKNSLGTNGVITYSRVAGSVVGSKYAAKVQITTAPTASQANGTEFIQVVENPQTLELLGNAISFAAQIKALGNVNQVGLQFLYATSEIKPSTALGSEALVSVNSSGFTLSQLLAQSVASLPTTAGVVGIRIRITGVSSGNTYDLNNGFVVEQATMNIGSLAANWARAGKTIADELVAVQRFYEKSYDLDVAPGTASSQSQPIKAENSIANGSTVAVIPYNTLKRASPTITGYSFAGTVNQLSNNVGSDVGANSFDASFSTGRLRYITLINSTGGAITTSNLLWLSNWTSDAEI